MGSCNSGGKGAPSGNAGGAKRRIQTQHQDKWLEPPSKAEQLAKENGIPVSEATEQTYALYKYSGASYGSIREAQYTNDTTSTYYEQAMAIENFIAQSPNWKGGELSRGISIPTESVKDFTVGKRVDMRGLSSWTTDPKISQNFAKTHSKSESSVIFKVSGTKQGASITHLSRFGKSESEVLISGKATWTIKSVGKQGNTTIIELSED